MQEKKMLTVILKSGSIYDTNSYLDMFQKVVFKVFEKHGVKFCIFCGSRLNHDDIRGNGPKKEYCNKDCYYICWKFRKKLNHILENGIEDEKKFVMFCIRKAKEGVPISKLKQAYVIAKKNKFINSFTMEGEKNIPTR